MKRSWLAVLSLVLVAIVAHPAAADVKLPAIIGDNMVLQQGIAASIWGWAEPGEKVTVSISGQTQSAVADKDGKWMLKLQPLKADDAVEMTVAGKNTITIKNILIGEVWVCGGQSNMQLQIDVVRDAAKEIAAANFPKIRLFTVTRQSLAQPQDDIQAKSRQSFLGAQPNDAKWLECSPETIKGFSAVAYFFGRDLHQKLNVPIGLINSNVGGTAAEEWTSAETLKAVLPKAAERYQQLLDEYPQKLETWNATSQAAVKQWTAATQEAKAAGKTAPRKPAAPVNVSLGGRPRPSGLYNAMIAPLIPYGIAGVIWYQGEANAPHFDEYTMLLSAMIGDWRKNWGQGDFPFLIAQLANYMDRFANPSDSSWVRLQEAQLKTLSVPKTGMAVINDIGEARDIHPKNKQDVGVRLSLAAQKIAYGKDVVYSGPIFDTMKIDGGKAVLTFKHVGGGLVAKGDKLVGFAMASADKQWFWADAKIVGDTVEVTCDKVATPVAVRYAWASNPACNLYNKEGLPTSAFRTDDWPLQVQSPSATTVPSP